MWSIQTQMKSHLMFCSNEGEDGDENLTYLWGEMHQGNASLDEEGNPIIPPKKYEDPQSRKRSTL
jgi:hypothetical protein